MQSWWDEMVVSTSAMASLGVRRPRFAAATSKPRVPLKIRNILVQFEFFRIHQRQEIPWVESGEFRSAREGHLPAPACLHRPLVSQTLQATRSRVLIRVARSQPSSSAYDWMSSNSALLRRVETLHVAGLCVR